jgi:hypothetical protein
MKNWKTGNLTSSLCRTGLPGFQLFAPPLPTDLDDGAAVSVGVENADQPDSIGISLMNYL